MSEDDRVLKPQVQAVAPPPSSGGDFSTELSEQYAQMLGLVRDIRAEVQNLRKTLVNLIERDEIEDEEVREREIKRLFEESRKIYDYNAGQIEARLRELRSLMDRVPKLYDRFGDETTNIENHWERATQHYPSAVLNAAEDGLPDAKKVLREANQAVTQMDILIYHAGLLTIPPRLNQHLEQVRIGQTLDFHATFKDEVPRKEDREKILDYLSSRPGAITNGIIDAAQGMVFHASSDWGRRRLSYVFIIGTALIGALATFLLSQLSGWFTLEGWPFEPDQAANMLVGYGFVIAGGVVHLGVDAIKQARDRSGQSILALDDWFLWVHINERGIIIGIVSLWIGFFGLLFLNGNVEWQTAFLIGYSIDSFVDMFLQRFSRAMATRRQTVKL